MDGQRTSVNSNGADIVFLFNYITDSRNCNLTPSGLELSTKVGSDTLRPFNRWERPEVKGVCILSPLISWMESLTTSVLLYFLYFTNRSWTVYHSRW